MDKFEQLNNNNPYCRLIFYRNRNQKFILVVTKKKMLIHNKVYNHRKKQKRLLEKQKLAKKDKTAEKHIYLGS